MAHTHSLSEPKFDVLCAVAEAAASKTDADLRDITACCPTVANVTPVLDALRRDGLVSLTSNRRAGLTARGATACRQL